MITSLVLKKGLSVANEGSNGLRLGNFEGRKMMCLDFSLLGLTLLLRFLKFALFLDLLSGLEARNDLLLALGCGHL